MKIKGLECRTAGGRAFIGIKGSPAISVNEVTDMVALDLYQRFFKYVACKDRGTRAELKEEILVQSRVLKAMSSLKR